jgi:hypothetical protein
MQAHCANSETIDNFSSNVAECLTTDGRKIASLEGDRPPHAVIKYGPPGSGKGSGAMMDQIAKLGVPLTHYITFEIDRLVEHVKQYRQNTVTLRRNRNKHDIANKNMYNGLAQAYQRVRTMKNKTGKSLNDKMDALVTQAIGDKKDIIFETTGSRYTGNHPFQWLLALLHEKGYKIVVIYPLATTDTLQERVRSRAEMQYAQPNEDKKLFRAVNPDELPGMVQNSLRNFKDFILQDLVEKRIHHLVSFWTED